MADGVASEAVHLLAFPRVSCHCLAQTRRSTCLKKYKMQDELSQGMSYNVPRPLPSLVILSLNKKILTVLPQKIHPLRRRNQWRRRVDHGHHFELLHQRHGF